MGVVAVHHTGTSEASWDGAAAEKALGTDYTVADLKDLFAWIPDGSDPNKADCVFPHHFVNADGKPGDASTVACSAVVAALNGGRGGTTIPDGDKRGVYNHVIAHLKDSGVKEADLPELKSRPARSGGLIVPELRERRDSMLRTRERRTQAVPRAQFEFRGRPDGTGGTAYSFRGYAATFESPFQMWDWWGEEYFEVLAAGACNRTLANQADVQFLIGHDESSIPLARTKSGTMTLSADSTGLEVVVPSLDGRSPIVQALASAMERGDMDEMSIGFIAVQQQWSPDYSERRITEININRGDVSVVCWAANPTTAGASMADASMAALPVSEAVARTGAGRETRTPTAPYSAKPGEDNECPQCHSMNDGDAAYCDQCGQAIRPTGQSTTEEAETQRCPCGNWNASDAKFCDQCGTNLASDLDADNGGRGNGATEAPYSSDWWAQQRRGEQRAAAAADDDEAGTSTKPAQDMSEHGPGSLVCPACSAPNGSDAAFCDQCGGALYDESGLITDGSNVSGADVMALMRAKVRVLQLRG